MTQVPASEVPSGWIRLVAGVGLFLAVMCSLSGCAGLKLGGQGGGKLAVQGQSQGSAILRSGFESGIYSFHDRNRLVVLLFDGPMENPTQVLTVRMHWRPRAGHTPIDHTATNASIQYIIFAGVNRDEVGIYSGAGFVYPNSEPGRKTLKGGVWHANLRLADCSDGFRDMLGQAVLEGSFTAYRDETSIDHVLHRVNVLIHQRLGYPTLVRADQGAHSGHSEN